MSGSGVYQAFGQAGDRSPGGKPDTPGFCSCPSTTGVKQRLTRRIMKVAKFCVMWEETQEEETARSGTARCATSSFAALVHARLPGVDVLFPGVPALPAPLSLLSALPMEASTLARPRASQ